MRIATFAALLIPIAVLSGCNGNTNPPSNPPTVSQIAGEYTGTATDSVFGNGTAAITLSQKASSIGGTLVETFGTTTLSSSLAMTIDLSGNLSGSSIATVNPSSPTCGFNVSGTYDPTTGNLNGTYAAYSGCTGQNGTVTLTQQCTDPSVPSALARRRPQGAHGILPC